MVEHTLLIKIKGKVTNIIIYFNVIRSTIQRGTLVSLGTSHHRQNKFMSSLFVFIPKHWLSKIEGTFLTRLKRLSLSSSPKNPHPWKLGI